MGVASAGRVRQRRQNDDCIVQTVTNPNTTQVQARILQWNNDVDNVNNSLNQATALISANNPGNLMAAAEAALHTAQDEPCQLMTLNSIPGVGTQAFQCAVSDLMGIFTSQVLDNLMTIINDPSNTNSVQSAVNDINNARCCNDLPDAGIIWQDAADNDGISHQVNTDPQRENACSTITCTDHCTTLPN